MQDIGEDVSDGSSALTVSAATSGDCSTGKSIEEEIAGNAAEICFGMVRMSVYVASRMPWSNRCCRYAM